MNPRNGRSGLSRQGQLLKTGGPGSKYRHLPGGIPKDNPDEPTIDALTKLLNYLDMVKDYPRMNFLELRRLVPMMRAVTEPSEELSLLLKSFEVEYERDNGAATRLADLVSEREGSLMQVLLQMRG